MKVSVSSRVNIICVGCGASTVFSPEKVYDLGKDVMCNCHNNVVDLTPDTKALIESNLEGMIVGLHNGADVEDFTLESQLRYAEYMVVSFDEAIAEGVPMNVEDTRTYAAFKKLLADNDMTISTVATEPIITEPELSSEDVEFIALLAADLEAMEKKQLKGIAEQLAVEVPSKSTNAAIIELILAQPVAELKSIVIGD